MSDPAGDGVRTEVTGGLLVCTIDRPQRGNSLRGVDATALAEAVEGASGNETTRGVLLRSAEGHFCTGADLSGALDRDGKPATGHMARSLAANAHRLIQAVWDCAVPVVAEVRGRADGLGCNLALAADVAVTGASASFSQPFTARGFSPDSGGTWLLPRRVGLTRAALMLYRATSVPAEEAERWGMVADVVADDDLQDAARSLADELASGATLALSLTKSLLHHHTDGGVPLAAAMAEQALAVELSIRSDDFKEGMKSFVERRSPKFTGR